MLFNDAEKMTYEEIRVATGREHCHSRLHRHKPTSLSWLLVVFPHHTLTVVPLF